MQTLLEPKRLVKAIWTDGFSVFRIYCALKGHFQDTFDVTKYGLKTKVKQESFYKRKDSVFFDRLASKFDAQECYLIMAYSMAANPDCLSYELSSAGAYQFYLRHTGRLETIRKHYKKDVQYIFELLNDSGKTFKDLLKGDGHPVILQLLIRESISVETVLLIDSFIPILESINQTYQDDILWSEWYIKLKQYQKLLDINNQLAKELFISYKKAS